jgi:hypothetical protein
MKPATPDLVWVCVAVAVCDIARIFGIRHRIFAGSTGKRWRHWLAPLERAAAMQPSLIQVHFQLAKAYRQLGRTEKARHETGLFSAMTNRIDTSRELKG